MFSPYLLFLYILSIFLGKNVLSLLLALKYSAAGNVGGIKFLYFKNEPDGKVSVCTLNQELVSVLLSFCEQI